MTIFRQTVPEGSDTMLRILESDASAEPPSGPDAHLWDYFCSPLTSREHLDFHLIDVEAAIPVPSKSNEQDRMRPLPRVEMIVTEPTSERSGRGHPHDGGDLVIGERKQAQGELVAFAQDIAARSDAIFNIVAVRFSENLAYLERREAAVRKNCDWKRLGATCSGRKGMEIECETHREFRTT